MSFELQIVLQRLLLPTICSLIGCYVLSRTDQSEDWYDDEPVTGMAFPTIAGAFLCAIGMIGSDLWQRGIVLKPSDWSTWRAAYQWQWMVWMIPSSMLVLALARSIFTIPIHYTAMAGVAVVSMAIGILYVCLNESVAWAAQSAKLLPWMALSCLAVTWNISSLNSIAKSNGSRWVSLTVLGQLGCVAAIVIQYYAGLAEWALAGIGVATGASVVGAFTGSKAKLHYGWQLSTVVMPLGIMAVACLAVGSFTETTETKQLPYWLVGSVLFLPSLVCVVDIVFGRLTNAWFRVFLAACVCCVVLGAIFNITKPWQSDW